MKNFNRLVSEQLKTMEKLLFLQSELERCQENLNGLTCSEGRQSEITRLKQDLKQIHQVFEQQTEDVIRSYQEMNVNC